MPQTYSFIDTDIILQHPLKGQVSCTGQGLGSVTVDYTDNNTESDIGADGNVMISRVTSHRGTVTVECQQTSNVNAWLVDLANQVDAADASQWAQMAILIKERFDNGLKITCTGCSRVKRPSRKDAQTGDKVSWDLFSANIIEEVA